MRERTAAAGTRGRLRPLTQFPDLYVSVHGRGLRCSHQAFQLGTTEILRLHGQFLDVHVCRQQLVPSHPGCVDVKDLQSALLIWQA